MDVFVVLKALDAELELTDEDRVEIIICGSAVIRLRYGEDIDTNDVDSLTTLSAKVTAAAKRVAVSKVGKQEELGDNWLNEQVIRIGIPALLPGGWEDRAINAGLVFNGRNGRLSVYALERSDLIRSKLMCLFDEFGRDIPRDVIHLKKMIRNADEAIGEARWVYGALNVYEPGRRKLKEVTKIIKDYLK